MTCSNGLESRDETRNGVQVLETSGVEDNWSGQNYSNGSIKQISYLGKINCAIDADSNKPCPENYAGVICESCGAKSLHALYIGYGFVERICEVCGARNETSQVTPFEMSTTKITEMNAGPLIECGSNCRYRNPRLEAIIR